ncbi:unnamed protein product, partial [Soboliphyme baturini]|uniref:Zinc finger SWIM domain-containing protein 8 n=1 Tax=Soboliphyme baturini TaxID=241478 RepID=A0A183ITA2_9BILA
MLIPLAAENDDDVDERLSWEDSERFEEDSLGSWLSEPESLCQNWRGWSRPAATSVASDNVDLSGENLNYTGGFSTLKKNAAEGKGTVLSLVESAASVVARFIPFEVVERFYPPVPEQLQLRVAFWSFPASEKDIRLYSCLANGNADEFVKGEDLYRNKAVQNILQIGFHLSATVNCSSFTAQPIESTPLPEPLPTVTNAGPGSASELFNVAGSEVPLRAPVSESLSRLKRDQLQKFAQYLISELPRQILPTAQKLLDELLTDSAPINALRGAPDPTAGAAVSEVTRWCLVEGTLHENIRKILVKFCIPSPTVFSDVNYLSSSAPPAASEWLALLRPLRGREPEGLWNLLSIVREMYRRHDRNAITLLTIITEECLNCNMVMFWWFLTKLSHSFNGSHVFFSINSFLWHLAVMNPLMSAADRQKFSLQLCSFHLRAVKKICKVVGSIPTNTSQQVCAGGNAVRAAAAAAATSSTSYGAGTSALPNIIKRLNLENAPFLLHVFPGFKKAIASCHHEWVDCQVDIAALQTEKLMMYKCEDGVDSSIDFNMFSRLCNVAYGKPDTQVLPLPVLRNVRVPSYGAHHSSWKAATTIGQDKVASSLHCSEVVDKAKSNSDISSSCCSSPPPSVAYDSHLSSGDSSETSTCLSSLREQLNSELPDTDLYELDFDRAAASSIHEDDTISSHDKPEASGDEWTKKSSLYALYNSLLRVKPEDDPMRVSFARCEALYAHGYFEAACRYAVSLVDNIVQHPPDLMVNIPPPIALTVSTCSGNQPMQKVADNVGSARSKRKKFLDVPLLLHPKAIEVNDLACELLTQVLFLLDVLLHAKNEALQHLSFRLGTFILELPRQPASSKFAEVKMNSLEEEMEVVRDKARRFISDFSSSKANGVLPLSLASYLYDCLCMDCSTPNAFHVPQDELLGFEVAVTALSMKTTVSETEHPLLHEGLRRQKGDLALALLLRYKDRPDKIVQIMDRILDRDLHQMYRSRSSNASHLFADVPESEKATSEVESIETAMSVPPCSRNFSDDQPSCSDRHLKLRKAALVDMSPTKLVMEEPAFERIIRENSTPVLVFSDNDDQSHSSEENFCPNGDVNTPSEAHAHFMMELAKRLLIEAGGNHSSSIFTNPQGGLTNQSHAGPHRALHLCAFQIGLYALGLHNKLTSNWLSRTYSSDVSWISAQAIEIGRMAIKILRDTWESHFTPTEVANLADKASLSRDPGMAQAAADLALSALSHAHALNPTEIYRALAQCREQNTTMLEKACLAVEQAAKDGGVYPEILFKVAQQWYRLYCELCVISRDQNPTAVGTSHAIAAGNAAGHLPEGPQRIRDPSSSISSNSGMFMNNTAEPHHRHQLHQQQLIAYQQQKQSLVDAQVMTPAHTLASIQMAAAAGLPNPVSTFPFIQPFYAISGAMPLNFGIPASLTPFSPSLQPIGFPFPIYSSPQQNSTVQIIRPASAAQQSGAMPVYMNAMGPSAVAVTSNASCCFSPFMTSVPPPPLHISHSAPNLAPSTPEELERDQNSAHYLYAAYRVGMLAMETMGRRVNDDRSYIKFSQNPPYGDDVKWLLKIAKKLGLPHVQQFCIAATQSIVSPFILWDIATDVALLFTRGTGSQLQPSAAMFSSGCCGSGIG